MRWRRGDGGGIDGDGDVMSAFLYCNECNVINGNQLEKLEAAKAA